MKTSRILIAVFTALFVFAASTQADIVPFDLLGKAGPGLLPGNENPTVVASSSGGEIGAGIFFDDVTLALTINVGWGSGNGFSDLTGTASAGHIHGPTTDPAPTSFTESAGILIPLDSSPFTWNPSATSGSSTGTVTLTSGQATDLFAGKLYVNIHTSANPGGEIRGYLVVPEPTTVALLALGAVGCLLLRRRRA
jgi:CHRD domain-containing protein/PEP-CTERM motif-containing protein